MNLDAFIFLFHQMPRQIARPAALIAHHDHGLIHSATKNPTHRSDIGTRALKITILLRRQIIAGEILREVQLPKPPQNPGQLHVILYWGFAARFAGLRIRPKQPIPRISRERHSRRFPFQPRSLFG